MAKSTKGKASTHGAITPFSLKADQYAGSLAHVIKIDGEGGREQVLGQAWLAAYNKLATAGHVVEAFIANPSQIIISFPNSGNRYQVKEIKLHPSFVRQPDQLVKFDTAVISVELHGQESIARPLPIVYEKVLNAQDSLSAIRYPIHLGQFSSAVNPLIQTGSLLGPLRKHDNFHLLHDLGLSPGDSGAPVFDGESVVAIHCGDTATLPGLNLPTTSIRLALWIDALRDLGIDAPSQTQLAEPQSLSPLPFALALALTCLASFAIVSFIMISPVAQSYQIQKPGIKPVKITLNHPRKGFKTGQVAQFTITPGSDSYLYLYWQLGLNDWGRGFPPVKGAEVNKISAGKFISIDRLSNDFIRVDPNPQKMRLIAISTTLPPLELAESNYRSNKESSVLVPLNGEIAQAEALKEKYPDQVLDIQFDGPVADPRL